MGKSRGELCVDSNHAWLFSDDGLRQEVVQGMWNGVVDSAMPQEPTHSSEEQTYSQLSYMCRLTPHGQGQGLEFVTDS